MIECCDNCRYAYRQVDNKHQCRRRAPQPYAANIFQLGELLRDVAWSVRVIGNMPVPDDDDEKTAKEVPSEIRDEFTEAGDYAVWPEVERDDWCGEWSDRGDAPVRRWTLIEEKPDE
jgi:hypothetical protein